MGVMNENLSVNTDSADIAMNIPQSEGQQSVLKVILYYFNLKNTFVLCTYYEVIATSFLE